MTVVNEMVWCVNHSLTHTTQHSKRRAKRMFKFILRHRNLQGTFPAQISLLAPWLISLDVSDNSFIGCILEIGGLKHLLALRIDNNRKVACVGPFFRCEQHSRISGELFCILVNAPTTCNFLLEPSATKSKFQRIR
eukprot:c20775_g3_i6.p1 GENE.c20775_g3_i6~~c20775_g3_i6.p1  ORF type:complete len:136 (+),score=34.00 c20775_g3_i6:82-489(+)